MSETDNDAVQKAALQLEIAASLERLRGNDELADSFAETADTLDCNRTTN